MIDGEVRAFAIMAYRSSGLVWIVDPVVDLERQCKKISAKSTGSGGLRRHQKCRLTSIGGARPERGMAECLHPARYSYQAAADAAFA